MRRPFRLIPRSLAGQMILTLLLIIFLVQAVSMAIFIFERQHAVRSSARGQLLAQAASVVRLLRESPKDLHGRIVESASGPLLSFSLTEAPLAAPGDGSETEVRVAQRLRNLLGADARRIGVAIWPHTRWRESDRRKADEREHEHGHPDRHHTGPRRALILQLSIERADGGWLNIAARRPRHLPPWGRLTVTAALLTGLATIIAVILMVRRVTRPLDRLTAAAENIGRGVETAPLPEAGPEDVRRTTRAFNHMRERLERYVSDRTRMLAAISHDLRTPITALRLRAEFIDDPDLQARIIETLDEMQHMTDATLAFAREDADREDTRVVDLTALTESIVDDQEMIGRDVKMHGDSTRMSLACRPLALKRALRNLIENAVQYGTRARVSVDMTANTTSVTIDDDGPGMAEADLEKVFEPFVRLEASRSRETGGIGLGLAIARTIARAHGGDVQLVNRPTGGLRATLTVPREPSDR